MHDPIAHFPHELATAQTIWDEPLASET